MILRDLKKDFKPDVLLPSITAGLVAGIIVISIEISLAALIFSGDLNQFLASGIGLMLFGAFVVGIIVTLTTSLPGMMAVPQDTPAAIMALVAAAIGVSMAGQDPNAVYATIVGAMSLTSILTAIFFLGLGRFKASGFVRYIPYPVVGGFLAGTGYLLSTGAFGVMVNVPLTIANLPRLFSAGYLIMWVPGVIFAITLLVLLRRWNHFLITPGALIAATAIFYGCLWIAGVSVSDASSRGWLLGPFPSGGLFQPLGPSSFGLIHWGVILQNLDKIATILVLSVIALLLNASGLEVTVKQDIDLNRELLASGWANLAGGIAGSSVGYQALGLSALAYRLEAKSRLVNLFSALLCGVALFFGASVISYFPRPVLGGIILFLGLSFLVEWLYDARKVLPIWDYLLVWVILIIIAAVGFLEGVIAGIFIAAILFVISYSRIDAIKAVLDGSIYHSKVDRPELHRDLLRERGAEIYILRLQGYIFFGTIQNVLERVRNRIKDQAQGPLKFLILDFQRVKQLDSSAVFGITRLKQLTEANKILMVWTQIAPEIVAQLERGGLHDQTDDTFLFRESLDDGLEWCENKILAAEGIQDLTGAMEDAESQLQRVFPSLDCVSGLMKYLEHRAVEAGEVLIKQDDPSDDMYFVESGLINVELALPNGQHLRLRSIRGGATVGEMGIYLGDRRTAFVVASRASTVYRLSLQSLTEMRQKDPKVAALFHEWIARQLAERIKDNIRMFEALMD
jgi:sulfate permease, SulP family